VQSIWIEKQLNWVEKKPEFKKRQTKQTDDISHPKDYICLGTLMKHDQLIDVVT
jgi:hypothetical protein